LRPVFEAAAFFRPFFFFFRSSTAPMSYTRGMGAASPGRGPILARRV
jgi:hypothetical protein